MALKQQLTKLYMDLKKTYNEAIEFSSIIKFHDELSNYVVQCSKLDESQIKQLIDCCLLFLECMATFIDLSDICNRNEIEGLHKCFKLIQDFLSSNEFSVGFVIHIAAPLLDIALRCNKIEWFTKELLRTFKGVFQNSSEAVRDQFKNSKSACLFKLVHQICECGDFEQQLLLLEVIYLIFSIDILKTNAPFVFPTCKLTQTRFANIRKDYFYHGARKFLNVVNSKFNKVLSLQFESASMGNRQFQPSEDQDGISELWVDFNLRSKCFTIPCTKTSSSFQQTSDTDLEIFKVPFDHIKKVKLSHCIIHFKLNIPNAEDLRLVSLDFKEDSLVEKGLSSLFKEKFENTIRKTPKGNSNKHTDSGGKYQPLILEKSNLISSQIETLSTKTSHSYFTCDSESQPRKESDSCVNKSVGPPLKDLSSAVILKRSNNRANENQKPFDFPKICVPGKLRNLLKRMGSNENDENLFPHSLKTFNRADSTVTKTCDEEEDTPSSKRRKTFRAKVSISKKSKLNQDECNVISQAELQSENANAFNVRADVSQEFSRETLSLCKINISNNMDNTISSNRNCDNFNGSVDIIEISDDDEEPSFSLNNNHVINLGNTRPSKCTNKYVSFGVASNADTNASARSSANCSPNQHLSRHERILENPAVQTLENNILSNELFHTEEESQNSLMLQKMSYCIRPTDTEIVDFIEISDDTDECSLKGTTDNDVFHKIRFQSAETGNKKIYFSKNVNNEINRSGSAKNLNDYIIENINSTEKPRPVDIEKLFGEDWDLVTSTTKGNIPKISEQVIAISKTENNKRSKSELENHLNRNKEADPDDLELANPLTEYVSMDKRSITPLDKFLDASQDLYSLKNGIGGNSSVSTVSIKNKEIQLNERTVNVSTVDEDCELRKENLNERESLYVSPIANNVIINTLQQSSVNNKFSSNSQSTLQSLSNEIIVDGYLGSSRICYTNEGSPADTIKLNRNTDALEIQEVNEQLSNSNSISSATNKSLKRNSVQANLFEKSGNATVGTEDNGNASSQNYKSVNAPPNDSPLLNPPTKKKEHYRKTFNLLSCTNAVQKHPTESNTVEKLPEHPPSKNNDSHNAEMELIRKVQNSPKPQSNCFDKTILKSLKETNLNNNTIISLKSCKSKGIVEKNKDVESISNGAAKSANKRITILQNLIITPAGSKTLEVRDHQTKIPNIHTLQDSLTRINSDKNFCLLIKSLLNYNEMCRKGGYQAKNKLSNSKSFKRQSGRFPKLNVTDQFNGSRGSSLKNKGEDANYLRNGCNDEEIRDGSNICNYEAILTHYKKVYQRILKFIKTESDRGNTGELHMFIDAILDKHNAIYKTLRDLLSNNLNKNKNNINFLKLIKHVDSVINKYVK